MTSYLGGHFFWDNVHHICWDSVLLTLLRRPSKRLNANPFSGFLEYFSLKGTRTKTYTSHINLFCDCKINFNIRTTHSFLKIEKRLTNHSLCARIEKTKTWSYDLRSQAQWIESNSLEFSVKKDVESMLSLFMSHQYLLAMKNLLSAWNISVNKTDKTLAPTELLSGWGVEAGNKKYT